MKPRRLLPRSDSLLKTIDATAGRILCITLGWCDYMRADRHGPATTATIRITPASRILMIRPGGLGDMILLLPALRSLQRAFPDNGIDMLCESRNASILPLAEFRGEILCYDRDRSRLWKRLRQNRYAIVIDTEQFHHLSAVLARLSGASCRIGFKINPVRNLLYTHLINYALDAPENDQFMRLLEPFGLGPQQASIDGILAAAKQMALPEKLLWKASGTEPDRRNAVALYAGASTPYKQWPVERFRQLIGILTAELKLEVALIGGREAATVSASLEQGFRTGGPPGAGRVISVAGHTSLPETAALLSRVSFFVGADCGLTHLAAAVGTPTITLFGPSDPLKWGHAGKKHRILRRGLSCSPCFIFGYHRLCRTRECMTAIPVAEVAAACRETMQSTITG